MTVFFKRHKYFSQYKIVKILSSLKNKYGVPTFVVVFHTDCFIIWTIKLKFPDLSKKIILRRKSKCGAYLCSFMIKCHVCKMPRADKLVKQVDGPACDTTHIFFIVRG